MNLSVHAGTGRVRILCHRKGTDNIRISASASASGGLKHKQQPPQQQQLVRGGQRWSPCFRRPISSWVVRASENEDPAPSPSADVPVGDDNPGFWWNPGTLKWVRDDKRGKPLSEWEEGGMTKITPKTGEAYTVWPAIHIQLSQFGLKSIPVEETLKLVKEGKAVVVDVRPEYQYKQEHVESSLNIPLFRKCQGDSMMASVKQLSCSLMGMQATERNPDFEQDAKKALGAMGKEGDDKMLIVACTIGGTLETEVKRETSMRKTSFKDPDRAFGRESRSLKAAFELIGLGYTNIAHLEGGIAMWRHKDMPMAK